MNAPLPPDAVAVAMLPILRIAASPSNPRKHFDDNYIAELAESIKSHGLIQPITVRPIPENVLEVFKRHHRTQPSILAHPPAYEIVVGECRWRAAKLAGLADIPGFWRELDDKQVLEIQVIENLQRRDVHPIEEAEGYERLMHDHGYKAEEIAAKIGKSRGYVYARLKLTALGNVAREAFYEGKLDASTALLVARIPGDKLQKKAVDAISTNSYGDGPMSYRSAKYHIQNHFTINLKHAIFNLADTDLMATAGSCIDCPKRSGNSPEICADLEDTDVCTDTTCFEQKRMARRDQLIANAEKRKIPVLLGDAGRDAFHSDEYIGLDTINEDDAQQRTYREILGDKAPVSALIEFGHGEANKKLFEAAEVTAIEKALKKAGWKPSENDGGHSANGASKADQRAQYQAEEAKREAVEQAADEESAWREKLVEQLLPRVEAAANHGDLNLNTDHVIILLAIAWLRQEAESSYDLPEELLKRWGDITLPEEYDWEAELETICLSMTLWPVGKAIALLFDALTNGERYVQSFNFDPEKVTPPRSLLALADLIGFDAQTLRNSEKPASTPLPAAQALGGAPTEAAPAESESPKKATAKKSKAKTKADPAPAMPANEPATPVKTVEPSRVIDTWPFPTGRRP